MIHGRHYTVEEANAVLEQIVPMIRRLREARDRLVDTDLHAALGEAAPTNGGGEPGRDVGEAFLEVRGILGALQEGELIVRDIDRGLVDFPSMRNGREVYLCWEMGEDEIAYWHELDAGFSGREPLD